MKKLNWIILFVLLLIMTGCQKDQVGNNLKTEDSNQEDAFNETENNSIDEDESSEVAEELSKDEEILIEDEKTISVTVLASILNVRKEPSTESEVIGKVQEWEVYEVIEIQKDTEDREWYKVNLSHDEVGWIAAWYCSETYSDSILGNYVTLINPTEHNSKLLLIANNELSKNGVKVKMDELSATTTNYSHVQLNNGLNKKSLVYELETTINLPINDDMGIMLPIFIDEDTLLYIMSVENNNLYLVKKNIYRDSHEIIYSMNIEGINSDSAEYYLRILSLTDHHIAYKLDNHIVIYNREEEIVEKHYQYDGVRVMDISDDLSKIIVDQEYSDYITSLDLSETSFVFEWNNEHELDFLGPVSSFSHANDDYINVGVNGYEWRAGEYVFDTQSGEKYNLGYSSDYNQNNEVQGWEYVVEGSSGLRLMCMYDYDLDQFKITAIMSDLNTINYLKYYYYLSDAINEYSYDLGQLLTNLEGGIVFLDLQNNIEYTVSGPGDNMNFECGNKSGELLVFSNDEGYYLYRRNED